MRIAAAAAAIAAAITALIAGFAAMILFAQAQHATLDAASTALRAELSTHPGEAPSATLARLAPALSTWGVDAAAFASGGGFIGGDDALRSSGLPAGQVPAVPFGRQMALVPTRGGYIIVVAAQTAIVRMRVRTILVMLLTAAVATLLASLAILPFARARSREAVRDLSQAEERMRAFLADAGHEFRTPLSIALGYAGILRRGALHQPALAERITLDIVAELERLERLVEQILLLARLDALPQAESAVADVRGVAQEAIALVRPLDPQQPIVLEEGPTLRAYIAEDDLRDALRNLLENALRYAPGAPILVRAGSDGERAFIEVTDNGPGMDTFTAEHAFDRFFRGPERGSVPGTGLGLSIVRRRIERAGGSVVLTTAPERGTNVRLYMRLRTST